MDTERAEYGGPQTPIRDGLVGAPSYPGRGSEAPDTTSGKVAGFFAEQKAADPNGLKAVSTADRWSLRIGNTATVRIEEHSNLAGGCNYSVNVQVDRADTGTTVVHLVEKASTYDAAYLAGVNLARELVTLLSIIDGAETLLQAATHRAEVAIRG